MPISAIVSGTIVPKAVSQELYILLHWDGEWEDGSSTRRLRTRTQPDGSFSIPDVPWEIPVRFTLELHGRAPTLCGPVTLPKGQHFDLGSVATSAGRTVDLRVTNYDGAPLPDARVDVSIPECRPKSARADSDGMVRVNDLPEWPVALTVSAGGYICRTIDSAPRRLQVQLERASILKGRVSRADGQACAGATVQAIRYTWDSQIETWVSEKLLSPCQTDGRGKFHLLVEAGRYCVILKRGGETIGRRWASVRPGDTKFTHIVVR